jgi:hypothetical protein
MGAARRQGLPALIGALAGLLIWALHFGLVYAANAVACERDLVGARIAGLPLLSVVVLGATALALAAVGVIGWRASRRLEGSLAGEEGEDMPRFAAWLEASAALLAALAILWEGLVPVLMLSHPCA